MFAGVNVFDQDGSLRTANAGHFAHNANGILQMVQRETADNNVERGVRKRKILRVGGTEGNVGEAALRGALLRNGEHRVGQIQADDFARDAGKSFGDVAGACGDVEDALVAVEVSGGNEALDAIFVGDPGIGGKGLGLRGEGFADDVV